MKKFICLLLTLIIVNFFSIFILNVDNKIYSNIIENFNAIEYEYVDEKEYDEETINILNKFYNSYTIIGKKIAENESHKLMNESISTKKKFKSENPLKYYANESYLQVKDGLNENIKSTLNIFTLNGIEQSIKSIVDIVINPIDSFKSLVDDIYNTITTNGILYFLAANVSFFSTIKIVSKTNWIKKFNNKNMDIDSKKNNGLNLKRKSPYTVNRNILLANNKYTTKNNYDYTTDSLGRIKTVNAAELKLIEGTRDSNAQRNLNKKKTDDAGHLIANQFGGSGSHDNLVAMDRNINRSSYKKLENKWKDALLQDKNVSVEIFLNYFLTDRPTSFNIKYCIEEVCQLQKIYNR